jgi:hypothetical protein
MAANAGLSTVVNAATGAVSNAFSGGNANSESPFPCLDSRRRHVPDYQNPNELTPEQMEQMEEFYESYSEENPRPGREIEKIIIKKSDTQCYPPGHPVLKTRLEAEKTKYRNRTRMARAEESDT